MTALRGAGHFVPWDGGCLLIGRAHDITPMHAHYALQIGVGRSTGIGFRSSDASPWTAYDVAIIPSRQPHAMDATRVEANAVLFIEPETRTGRAISERYLQQGICNVAHMPLRACVDALFAAWDTRRLSAVIRAAQDLIGTLTNGVSPATVTDPRVLRSILYINAHLAEHVTLDDAAAEACLSPSRFRHVFIEETGMAFRPFVLWRRFVRAWNPVHQSTTRGCTTWPPQTGHPPRTPSSRGSRVTPAALRSLSGVPIRTSPPRPARRRSVRPLRVSSVAPRNRGQSHSKRSRPSRRRGRWPVSGPDSHTFRNWASSSASCAPDGPAPTTSTGPSGSSNGFLYSLEWHW